MSQPYTAFKQPNTPQKIYQLGPSSLVEFVSGLQVIAWVLWLMTKTCSVYRPEHSALCTLHCPNHVKLKNDVIN